MNGLQLAATLIVSVLFADAPMAQSAMPVSVVKAVRAVIAEEVHLTGDLRAKRISNLSSEVEGLIQSLLVDDGDVITKGQVVLVLDSELALIATSQADAAVDEAQARQTEAGRRLAELMKLEKKQHVPKTNVAAARAEIQITHSVVAQAQAIARRARAMLDRHTVRAPFGGVIATKLVEIGQWIETSDPLVALVETNWVRLQAQVPQLYFGRVEPGMRAIIHFDARPNEILDAVVSTKIAVSDGSSRTFPVLIDIANERGTLAPGMSARVTLQIGDQGNQKTLMVPQDAIVRRADGSQSVWTIVIEDGQSKAKQRKVETGRVYRDNIKILNGMIEPGTHVIVRGNEILRPGQLVIVAEKKLMDI